MDHFRVPEASASPLLLEHVVSQTAHCSHGGARVAAAIDTGYASRPIIIAI